MCYYISIVKKGGVNQCSSKRNLVPTLKGELIPMKQKMKIYINYLDNKVDFMPTSEDEYYEEIKRHMEDGWRQAIIDDEISQDIILHYFLNKGWSIDKVLVDKHNSKLNMKELYSATSLADYISEAKRDRGFIALILKELSHLEKHGFYIDSVSLSMKDEMIEFKPNGVCEFTEGSADDILDIVGNYLLKGED